ncbi:septation protein SepH [Ornithinimicrobium sp. W1679]|uniref:septation protein SepH n=1 Tax=Ornithinimicrobium sp. W1679 TaxID=3418770 RepID=UPI003CEBA367
MQQLQFKDLDEGGRLVLVGEDQTHYVVTVDDRLRAALRTRPHAPAPEHGRAGAATPREVQAMIRAGQTAEEVASGTGWELARVRRFEGPVLAEREHVVGLARAAHVRAAGRTDGSHTLDRRVRERLQARGVQPQDVGWDAARTGTQGPWTVQVTFMAGGRERRAVWHYSVPDRSIEALDDEARWLSEDEQALPGGLAGNPLLGSSHAEDETADLMATMRERRQRRGRRTRRPETAEGDAAHVPGQQTMPEEVLPLEDLRFDPETMGDPPAAHPRGSAPEAPSPVHPPEEAAAGEPAAAPEGEAPTDEGPGEVPDEGAQDRAPGGRPPAGRSGPRKERRRLRIPKLPTPVGEPEEDVVEDQPDLAYARRGDPQEVSFEEFFGTDDEGDPVDDDVVDLVEDDGTDVGDDMVDVEDDMVDVEDVEDVEDVKDFEDVEDVEVERPDGPAQDVADGSDEDGEGLREADAAGTGPVADDGPAADVPDVPDDVADGPVVVPPGTAEEAPAGEGKDAGSAGEATRRRAKGRPSVPSWDDIMFGAADRKR